MAVSCLALLAGSACAARRSDHIAPEPQVNIDPEVLEKFTNEVREYVALRKRLTAHIPPVPPHDATPEQLAAHQWAMKLGIQQARKGAQQGEFFKKSVEAAIRRVIQKELASPEGAAVREGIKQGNPAVEGVPLQRNPTVEVKKDVPLRVNGDYPDSAPLSSVPPSLLLKLPQLPEEVRFRVVGRHLILRDTEANVILDYIWNAFPELTAPR